MKNKITIKNIGIFEQSGKENEFGLTFTMVKKFKDSVDGAEILYKNILIEKEDLKFLDRSYSYFITFDGHPVRLA